jgi:hypothetical protein
MRDQALTRREETRLIKAYQRFLLGGGFPNPNRAGCPGNEILKAMAFRKLDNKQTKDWIDHLGTCTPCFREYSEFRKQVERRLRTAYAAMAAAVVLVLVSVGWWSWRASHPVVITAHHQIVADLRGRFTPRGEEGTKTGKRPLVFERGIDEVSIYLPEGSRAGTYEVSILREDLGEPLTRATAVANAEKDKTSMRATLDLSRVRAGHYLLAVRLAGVDWNYFPLVVK